MLALLFQHHRGLQLAGTFRDSPPKGGNDTIDDILHLIPHRRRGRTDG